MPRGQERPRFGARAYKTAEAKAYENEIAWAFKTQVKRMDPITGPVGVKIFAAYPVPASDTKIMTERKLAGIVPTVIKPDLDNVVKAVLDALNGVAWLDDRQVVTIEAKKTYAQQPGMHVMIFTETDLRW